jgi:hypothetical protein
VLAVLVFALVTTAQAAASGSPAGDSAEAQAEQAVTAAQAGGPAGQSSGPAIPETPDPAESTEGLPEILGPAAPFAPEMVRRDEAGNATMRAVRISRPLSVDGRLDDEVYATIPAVSDFIQQFPREGELASEQTEVWIMFDDDTLYIAGRCYDSQPDRAIANELRRDHNNIFQGDNITVVFDTFYGASPASAARSPSRRSSSAGRQPGSLTGHSTSASAPHACA